MPWLILTDRNGRDTRDPTLSDIETVVIDLHNHFDDPEHSSISLRRVEDEGPLYVLDLTGKGTMIYSHYSDADFENLVAERKMVGIGVKDLYRRLDYLKNGQIDDLELCQWET